MTPVQSLLNPFAAPFGDVEEESRIASLNAALLRRFYPGLQPERLTLRQYDAYVRQTRDVVRAERPPDPVNDWLDSVNVK